ncbi:MAG: BolA family transcriptional regulator [Rhodospirillales bacterium]
MTVAETMERKLREAFRPARLELEDQSHLHAGHAGHNPAGESHFHLILVSEAFAGQSRVARQRAVYQVLAEELSGRVHALSLETRTPEEEAA